MGATIIKILKMTNAKVYIAGAGMIGLGVYQITEGDFEKGYTSIMAGLALIGGRAAYAKGA